MGEGGLPFVFCVLIIAVMVMVFGLTALILNKVLVGLF